MKDAGPHTIYLADYLPPAYLVTDVHLTFRLSPDATRVIARIGFVPNPASIDRQFRLDGENLSLIWARVDSQPVTPDVTQTGLTCAVPDAAFVWETEVEIAPASNTALEGLYMSGGMYCTQCEAEGFRKITYYPDRPDVMAVFTVRIESDMPVLLSNGNPVAAGAGWAEWHDPWPKPAYLFALVAGELVAHSDTFVTMSGKEVGLNIYVRPADIDKCAFGMGALKRSMAWDEQTYRREYDLDIFNIVAVDDFNMGAMENKGLNIFNSSCVLASSATSTDADFERIEAIIAHEYFHNWTGNRITCRDWFQLCLKEGLTVFRDQQFTGDMRSHAVKRIDDVMMLRSRQFREDAGPLAHPVRPDSFVEINNFYTATVYEKGAELIGMLKLLVGDAGYDAAVTLYFDRHDGQAATIEDWLAAFTDATGRDLIQFARWYGQAGTPHLTVTDSYADGTYHLHVDQMTPPTPGQTDKVALHIPLSVGLLSADGTEVQKTATLELTESTQTFSFNGLGAKPIPSILRNFSAPVVLAQVQTTAAQAFLLAHDTDPFNRWEAGRALALHTLVAMVHDDTPAEPALFDGLASVLRDDTLDPAFRARVLAMPTQDEIAAAIVASGTAPDPTAIWQAQNALGLQMAQFLQDVLPRIAAQMHVPGPFDPGAEAAGKRALGNAVMGLLTRIDGGAAARKQYHSADNMTQQRAALAALLAEDMGQAETQAFYQQWQGDRLVIDKWFGLQAAFAHPEKAAETVKLLSEHPDFKWKNPNRFRALLGGFAGNAAGFHHPGGAGYALLADWLIRLDPVNPQTTARMCGAFETWRRYDSTRQSAMQAALRRIAATPNLSRDVTEMVGRILG